MSVLTVRERPFFPLDEKLKLRADRWSEGAARVATRQGLQARSFELAAESFEEAVGSSISADTLRRITQGWGQACLRQRQADIEKAYDLSQSKQKAVEQVDPIVQQANLATDGGMMHIRGEGWKEVKLVTVSAVRPKRDNEKGTHPDGRRYAPWEPQMTLERHSYQAILGSADEMEPIQYLEGCRRGLLTCPRKSGVSDAALWIERITATNFPNLTQIVDWFHASERLWDLGKACFSDKETRAKWVQTRQDDLWAGQTDKVVSDLLALAIPDQTREDVADTPGYFDRHQERMRYHQYRVAGYPIGSGTVESGVNIVVHHRLKRQGRGWQRDNAQAMLAALSQLHSNRFDWAWQRTN